MSADSEDVSSRDAAATAAPLPAATPGDVVVTILLALSLSHGLNDAIQALLPAIYPLLKASHGLTFTQIGLITFTFQCAGSLFQPFVGFYTDRRPLPYSLPVGMGSTLIGLVLLSRADSFPMLLVAAVLVGTGSAVFHPEASRLARLASGGRHGFAQSLFQVGGNFGTSVGPLLAAWVVVPRGQRHVLWFSLLALLAMAVLSGVGTWYQRRLAQTSRGTPVVNPLNLRGPLSPRATTRALVVLGVLVFSKFIYLSSLTSYYTFFLIEKFGISVERAQVLLFVFLFAAAVGTILGGPVGDRWGRKIVIWISILGVAPFTLLLPHVGLAGCGVLTAIIGVILASAFSAILVYAQELLPGRVGMIAGLFFGFAFGMAGIGSAVLGAIADRTSIFFVFDVCAWLPLLGLLTVFLPDLTRRREA